MQAINEQQREFVLALMRQGLTLDYTAAARSAGYCAENPETANRAAYRLAHDEKVLAAIHEEAYRRLQAGTLAAVELLTGFIGDAEVDSAVRLKAATALMDRAGLHAKSEHLVAVSHTDDRQSKLLRLAELARAAGQDPKLVLGSLADALEGDYSVLEAGAVPALELARAEPMVDVVPRETVPAGRPLITDIEEVQTTMTPSPLVDPAPLADASLLGAVQWR
jgi:hypothetical protein